MSACARSRALLVLSGLLSMCAADRGRVESDLLSEPARYSQHQEESIIRHFFRDRRGGFFVDVGCAAPIRDSNTYYLEKYLGWSGIAVDALREYGPVWQDVRPRSRFYVYLVTDHSGTVEPFYRSVLPGVSTSLAAPHGSLGEGQGFEEVLVRTQTLTRLLEENDVSRFDLLSMDIEGSELLALAGFDIERFQPALVIIEAKPSNRESILAYFASHRYARIDEYLEHDEVNYYFTPERSDR